VIQLFLYDKFQLRKKFEKVFLMLQDLLQRFRCGKGTYHRPCPVKTEILGASAENKIIVSCYSSGDPESEVRIYDLSNKTNVFSRSYSEVHTATMSKDGSTLFVAHGPEGQVMLSMVDTRSSRVIGDVKLAITPSDLIYDAATGRLVAAPSRFSPQPNNVIQLLDVSIN